MDILIWHSYLYDFLALTESSSLEKKILDCGAGGPRPPLALFHSFGYEAHGIDISERQVEAASTFSKKHNLDLRMKVGDMRKLPYESDSFSHVFTQNTLCHLPKADAKKAVEEMIRVLKKDGYLFVDFMSTDCSFYGAESMGDEVNPGEFLYIDDDGDEVLHCFYDDSESHEFLSGLETVKVVKISTENHLSPTHSKDVRLYYYLKKPA
ncbi:MAG: class I SAM-dependent methyltransferase [Promethearchaeota archaeon]